MNFIFKHIKPTVFIPFFSMGILMGGAGYAQADPVGEGVANLQHGWAHIYYQVPKQDKVADLDNLATQANQLVARYPTRAEPLVWDAIIVSTQAKFEGGLGALSKAKKARDLLEQAKKIQPDVLNGSIYSSLGSLYANVPGWPIGFGDAAKAKEYLTKALAINPDGIDPNYFYGEYWYKHADYAQAKTYLEKALSAPARPGREDADQGRRSEARQLLEKVKQHS